MLLSTSLASVPEEQLQRSTPGVNASEEVKRLQLIQHLCNFYCAISFEQVVAHASYIHSTTHLHCNECDGTLHVLRGCSVIPESAGSHVFWCLQFCYRMFPICNRLFTTCNRTGDTATSLYLISIFTWLLVRVRPPVPRVLQIGRPQLGRGG